MVCFLHLAVHLLTLLLAMVIIWETGKCWNRRLPGGLSFGRRNLLNKSCKIYNFHLLLIANHMFCSSHHNAFLDEANQGKDMASLDFAALDKLAEDWEAGEL